MKLIFFFCFACCSLSFSNLQLKEEIPEIPFVYQGLSPREIITCDANTFSILESYLEIFLETLPPDSSLEQILHKLSLFVFYKIFDSRLCNDQEVEKLVQKTMVSPGIYPELPLEIFLKARIGICRHISLCTSLLLDKLIKRNIIQGHVLLIRDETPYGRHAWSLVLTKENAWHVDPYWKLVEDAKTPSGWEILCRIYGKKTMERQKERWN